MFDPYAIFALLIALAAVAVLFLGARQLLASQAGRYALLVGAGLLPLAASAGGLRAGIQESSRTRFCLSCHEMQRYGKSLFVDDRRSVPAVHFQNRLVQREDACFACHTDYALFGDLKAKLNGLKHVYVHFLGRVPEKIELYQPYPSSNCLHCHEDARRFLEAPPHQPVSDRIASGQLSCLECHKVGHDLTAVKQGHFWQAQ